LAALRNCRIKASEEEIALALQGHWRREHLFALKQALEAFDFCGQQLAELDAQIEAQLQRLQVTEDESRATRRSSTCGLACSACAAWTSPPSPAWT
jgi:transposase